MSDDLRARIRQMLEAHSTLTLATQGSGEGPWAAAVFYASDAALRLYFVSDGRTRHGRDLAVRPHAFAAINADVSSWDDVRGLQLEGGVTILDCSEREAALACYLDKFADVRRLFEAPRDEHEQLIGARLRGANFHALTPRWIRLIDNREGFGWKRELTLS
jgi:uncharacterized protein YhbP (UPF0306 family)